MMAIKLKPQDVIDRMHKALMPEAQQKNRVPLWQQMKDKIPMLKGKQ